MDKPNYFLRNFGAENDVAFQKGIKLMEPKDFL
jgi:hypothetical protein